MANLIKNILDNVVMRQFKKYICYRVRKSFCIRPLMWTIFGLPGPFDYKFENELFFMKKTLIVLFMSAMFFNTHAQLPNGSIASDFTLTDINGVTHHLYNYLDQGKTVIIDCFAAHCGTCWNYHNQHAIENLHLMYGPEGTENQDVIVLAVEQDAGNGTEELYGISGNTQGNWIEGTTHPVVNPEGSERTEFIQNYQVVYYPMVYAICPDRTTTLTGTQPTAVLYETVLSCNTKTSVDAKEASVQPTVKYNSLKSSLDVRNAETGTSLRLFNITGSQIYSGLIQSSNSVIDLPLMANGIYFCSFLSKEGKESTVKFYTE